MTTQTVSISPALLVFIYEVSAVQIDDFWYASSPVLSPLMAAVGVSASDALLAWVEFYHSGVFGA